ncbi:hypothetical protein SeLEV6574_g02144 [Synchytrium endobioticum]|nr:hypothetical protein SeLEV6574_g02144 [Synchytrium endobioticum]
MPKLLILAFIAVQVMLCCIHPSAAGGACTGGSGRMVASPRTSSEGSSRDDSVRSDQGTQSFMYYPSNTNTVVGPSSRVESPADSIQKLGSVLQAIVDSGVLSLHEAPFTEFVRESVNRIEERRAGLNPFRIVTTIYALMKTWKNVRHVDNPETREALEEWVAIIKQDAVYKRVLKVINKSRNQIPTNLGCGICQQDLKSNGWKLGCNHCFHSWCIMPIIVLNGPCPYCTQPIEVPDPSE